MKTLFRYSWLICLSCCTTLLVAQPTAAQIAAAQDITQIEFVEAEIDFGQVEAGLLVYHTYHFSNTGDEPLQIAGVSTSCGCLVPSWPKEPIPAGEAGRIDITFNSMGKMGLVDYSILVLANTDPTTTSLTLGGIVAPVVHTFPEVTEIEAAAIVPVNASPTLPAGPTTSIRFDEESHDFGSIEEGTVITHVFTFTNTGEEPLIITDARGSCGCTVPQVPRAPIAPGETASITVQFNSKNKKGKRNQKVTISANTDPQQTFVYLTGTVEYSEGEAAPNFDFVPDEQAPVEMDPSCFAIYPNPTAELLRMDLNKHTGQQATISIYSQGGQLMAERKLAIIDPMVTFTVDHYPPGTYIASVQVKGKKVETKCFVVVE